MGKPFADEISALPGTIRWGLAQEIQPLKRAIDCQSGRNLIAIGSGGSFSLASYLALLHESQTRKLARAATPFEVVTSEALPLDTCFVLLTAEGRNKDIVSAAIRLHEDEAKGYALALRKQSPLGDYCQKFGVITPISFDMPWHKDGYLATNSLIAMMVLLSRAYPLSGFVEHVASIDEQWLNRRRSNIVGTRAINLVAATRKVIVVHGSVGVVAARDLESKLAESGLAHCQFIDLRQFAHGRHLQMAAEDCPAVIAFGCDADLSLMQETLDLLPAHVEILRIDLPRQPQAAEVIGVIEAMLITESIAVSRKLDPGNPEVPQFGRAIYSLDVAEHYTRMTAQVGLAYARKLPPLGPTAAALPLWSQAGQDLLKTLSSCRFKAIVCDFDGTCCETDQRADGITESLVTELSRLMDLGLVVAFATGRGDSLCVDLRSKFERCYWPRIIVGYYSGSHIATLDADFVEPPNDERLFLLSKWIEEIGMDSDVVKQKIAGGQLSIRMRSLNNQGTLEHSVSNWIKRNQCVGWRVFRSGHSIDVLTEAADKRKVVDFVAEKFGLSPQSEVLRFGDSGDFGGNDFELLAEGVGLSVARVSPLCDSCWNILPRALQGTVGMRYYLNSLVAEGDATVKFSQVFINSASRILANGGHTE